MLDLDPTALALWGASAGGHLVALAGLLAGERVLPGEPDGPVDGDVLLAAAARLSDALEPA